jgi:NCAIR mutase (PurE)-related protein
VAAVCVTAASDSVAPVACSVVVARISAALVASTFDVSCSGAHRAVQQVRRHDEDSSASSRPIRMARSEVHFILLVPMGVPARV